MPILNPSCRKRVLIVDDHPAVREALSLRIGLQSNLEVCGEASDVPNALQLFERTSPDITVVDLSLKSGSGLDLIKRIKDRDTGARILVWSMHSEALYAQRVLRAGALGYVSKECATDTIIQAIQQVLAGQVWLSEDMTARLLTWHVGFKPEVEVQTVTEALSDRELEVFCLIGEGITTADIARQLHLSVKTIETYRDRIRLKLDLQNGTELVRAATAWVLEKR